MHKTLRKGKLVFKDGSVYEGTLFGGKRNAVGEAVFTTNMFGYQETLTDPSFSGQIVVMTYPLLGNYGCNAMFNQSKKSFCQGFVVGELCDYPSNWRSEQDLEQFLEEQEVPVLVGVDTRAITRKIRNCGVMQCVIVPEEMPQNEVEALLNVDAVKTSVAAVSTSEAYTLGTGKYNIAVLDLGIKQSVLDFLLCFDCCLTVYPALTSAEEIMSHNHDGIFLSSGAENTEEMLKVAETVKVLLGRAPIFGVGVGHQVLALANGAGLSKMKFGHHGVNQPVKDLRNGRIYITAQNHGYVVDEKSLADKDIKITHVSMNDGTVEGLEYTKYPAFSVQYHTEASFGPGEHEYLFKHFVDLMEAR